MTNPATVNHRNFFLALVIAIIIIAPIIPAQAAPAGEALVIVADCRESIVFWLAPTYAGPLSNTYAAVIMDATEHGITYPVEMYYQYTTTLANGRAVYRAIGWQPFSLNAEKITITGGWIVGPGGVPLEPILTGKEFVMGCWQVHMPRVLR
jgi:hypothetical protein